MIGREGELRDVRQFLAGAGSPSCFVISGEAGIGKTTVWEAGLEAAEADGYIVLSARASEAEVALSYVALADLVDGIAPDVLSALPAPQLRALEVALRRRDPVDGPLDHYAISAGFLGAVRALADRTPLLVAIDDVDWLDSSSDDALLFAARRLPAGHARFLVTRRTGVASGLERVLQGRGVVDREVMSLSFGATGRVLSERLSLTLSRHVLRQVHEASQGNPMFALELGRTMVAEGMPEIGSELPVPHLADDVCEPRVRKLPAAERRALLAVALSAGLSRSELALLVDPMAIDDAIGSGMLSIDRNHVRAAHPMFAAAARHLASRQERRDLHRQLADAISDATLRARHLSLAEVGPNSEVASIVANAADLAANRGAAHDAEELGSHALRLTPPGSAELSDRVLALGRFHLRADNLTGVTALLTSRMDEVSPGRGRAIAHLLIGEASDLPGDLLQVDLALAEGGHDPEVRALALSHKSRIYTVNEVARLDEAEAWAAEAVVAAREAGIEVEDRARASLAWTRVFRGRPVDDLIAGQPRSRQHSSLTEATIDRAVGRRLTFRGELDTARALYDELLTVADERGDVQSGRFVHQLLCDLELRAGEVHQATRWLDQLDHLAEELTKVHPRLRALLAAVTGDPTETIRWAAEVLEDASRNVSRWDRLEATRALGIAALLRQDPTQAVEHLKLVWEHTVREKVDEPGAFPVAGDLAEALVQSGEGHAARDIGEQLGRLAADQAHPWAATTATRCAAMVDLADGYSEGAAAQLAESAEAYGRLGLGFDRARTLLYLGGVQRRAKKRSAARSSLEAAEQQFDGGGSTGWAQRARTELARISGRRSGGEQSLTPTEQRIANLAAEGLSNKEIARQLFVSVNTVEGHLSRSYAKLGVRSRAQLTHRLGEEGDTEPPG